MVLHQWAGETFSCHGLREAGEGSRKRVLVRAVITILRTITSCQYINRHDIAPVVRYTSLIDMVKLTKTLHHRSILDFAQGFWCRQKPPPELIKKPDFNCRNGSNNRGGVKLGPCDMLRVLLALQQQLNQHLFFHRLTALQN
jgi:hypothetical protein